MITLNDRIQLDPVSKLKVIEARVDKNGIAHIEIDARGLGGENRPYGTYHCFLANGDVANPPDLSKASTGIRLNVGSKAYLDGIEIVRQLNLVDAANRIETILDGVGNRATKYRAIEQDGLDNGWIIDLSGVVS